MKEIIAIVGDTHSDDTFVANVIKDIKRTGLDVTTIVQLGDFGYTFNRNMIESISAWLAHRGRNRWIWLDGNHDEHNFLDDIMSMASPRHLVNMEGMEYGRVSFPDRLFYAPRGSVAQVGSKRCMFMGGAYSIDEHYRRENVSWWSQETIREKDILNAAEQGKVDVMFTHDSPFNPELDAMLQSRSYKVDAKSNANRAALTQVVRAARPEDLYHGHFHHRYEGLHETEDGWSVKVHGVGANVSPRGYIDHACYPGQNVLYKHF